MTRGMTGFTAAVLVSAMGLGCGAAPDAITIKYAKGAPFAGGEERDVSSEAEPVANADSSEFLERKLVQDFEGAVELNPWPAGKRLEFSSEWKVDGERSVRLYDGVFFAFSKLAVKDWTGFDLLRIHTFVPGDKGVVTAVELTDRHRAFHNRHQNQASAAPGEGVIELDISGDLWRGEVNRPYRGNVKTPIEKNDIRRIAVGAKGGDVMIDKVEIVKTRKLATPGGKAFDFSRKGHLVQGQYAGVDERTIYNPSIGHGFHRSGAWGLHKCTPYPTPMMGNGLDFKGTPFHVDLAGGPYRAWVVFERSGFWGGEQAAYKHAQLLMNGDVVHEHRQSGDEPFFAMQDREILTQDQVVDMVLARQGTADFTFTAKPGKNTFTYETTGVTILNLRIAGLVVAPDTDAGRAFIQAHKDMQTAGIAAMNRLMDRGERTGKPAEAKTPIVVAPLTTETVMCPRDWPAATESQAIPAVDGLPGMDVCGLIGVYATKPFALTAKLSALKGPGGEIPAQQIEVMVNRYMPMRGYEQSACWAETLYYRPMTEPVPLSATVARSVLLRLTVPKVKPGIYAGVLELKAENAKLKRHELTVQVPVKVRVRPGNLPKKDFPTGLFMSALPVPKKLLSDADYWRLNEDLLSCLARAGMNLMTGGPNFGVKWNGNTPVIHGADALKMLALAKKHGMDRVLTNYGGFSLPLRNVKPRGGMSKQQVAKALFDAFEAFRKEHDLPEYIYYAYDEPSTEAEVKPVRERLPLLRNAGFKTIGYTSMSDPAKADEKHLFLAKATTHPAFNIHSPATLKFVREQGNTPWVYNNGLTRYAQGLHLWRNHRAGAAGRIDWIAAIVQGYQFDLLDSREPDRSCFYVHRELGVLPSPRLLGILEGSLDARLLFELERRVAAKPERKDIAVFLAELEALPYRKAMPWEQLAAYRERMWALLDASK